MYQLSTLDLNLFLDPHVMYAYCGGNLIVGDGFSSADCNGISVLVGSFIDRYCVLLSNMCTSSVDVFTIFLLGTW